MARFTLWAMPDKCDRDETGHHKTRVILGKRELLAGDNYPDRVLPHEKIFLAK